MSNVYSLADLRNDLDKEFAPLTIDLDGEQLVLRNLMRIGETERETVMRALKDVESLQGDDEDAEPTPEELTQLTQAVDIVLKTVTANGKGEKLVQNIAGDMALSMKIMELWTEATQPGEATNSPA